MYERFDFNPSRARYKEIVNQTLIQTTEFIERFPEVIMYHSIYNQILDIKNKVIDNNMRFSDDGFGSIILWERLPFGILILNGKNMHKGYLTSSEMRMFTLHCHSMNKMTDDMESNSR